METGRVDFIFSVIYREVGGEVLEGPNILTSAPDCGCHEAAQESLACGLEEFLQGIAEKRSLCKYTVNARTVFTKDYWGEHDSYTEYEVIWKQGFSSWDSLREWWDCWKSKLENLA